MQSKLGWSESRKREVDRTGLSHVLAGNNIVKSTNRTFKSLGKFVSNAGDKMCY